MQTAKRLMIIVVVCGIAVPALADWKVGEPYKMETLQLPDPTGYDINMTKYTLADDWKCSQSGLVTDIHFWYSVKGDDGVINPPHIQTINVSIFDDIPAGPDSFSRPGALQRSWAFDTTQFRVAPPEPGLQGWDNPEPDSGCLPQDHTRYFQVNIENILQPFYQDVGKIYWLALNVVTTGDAGTNPPLVGWKTTTRSDAPILDWAVYKDDAVANGWLQIAVCTLDHPTDLAFVITPEPATLCLLALGGLALLKRQRKS